MIYAVTPSVYDKLQKKTAKVTSKKTPPTKPDVEVPPTTENAKVVKKRAPRPPKAKPVTEEKPAIPAPVKASKQPARQRVAKVYKKKIDSVPEVRAADVLSPPPTIESSREEEDMDIEIDNVLSEVSEEAPPKWVTSFVEAIRSNEAKLLKANDPSVHVPSKKEIKQEAAEYAGEMWRDNREAIMDKLDKNSTGLYRLMFPDRH